MVARSLTGNAVREPEMLLFLDAFFPFRFAGVYKASESGNDELLEIFFVSHPPLPHSPPK